MDKGLTSRFEKHVSPKLYDRFSRRYRYYWDLMIKYTPDELQLSLGYAVDGKEILRLNRLVYLATSRASYEDMSAFISKDKFRETYPDEDGSSMFKEKVCQ